MLNQVSLIGNVGSIDISITNGKEFASLSLAVNEKSYEDKNGNKVEKTNWFRVVIFSEHYKKIIKEYVQKGHKLFVQGSLQNSQYTDKEGVTRYNTDVHVTNFDSKICLLTPRKSSDQDASEQINFSEQISF